MAEGAETASGEKLDIGSPDPGAGVEREFAAAMARPADGDSKAPPKRRARAAEDSGERPRTARAPRTPKPPAGKASTVPGDRPTRHAIEQGMAGVIQVPAAIAMLASRRFKDPARTALQADAIVLISSSEKIAAACADTAEADERFARLMGKVCAAGPYGSLIACAFEVGGQLARNHGIGVPGTQDPADIVAAASVPPAEERLANVA